MKTRIAIIAIMLLLALFVTGCEPPVIPSTPAAEPTNFPSEPTNPNIENLSLYDKLPYLVADAYNQVEACESIQFEESLYIWEFITAQDIEAEIHMDPETGKEIYTVFTQEKKDQIVYLVLLNTLTTEYSDCVYFIDEYFYDHPYESASGVISWVLFVSDQYAVAGYENAKEYYHAMEADECGYPSDALIVWFSIDRMYLYTDWLSKTELFSDLLAAAKNGN